MRILLAATSALALALTACSADEPETFTVRGAMSVAGGISQSGIDGEECVNSRGYRDITAGTQVVVTDADGTTLALGELDPGWLVGVGDRRCVFEFEVPDVPTGHEFYRLQVGDRGEHHYDAETLQNGTRVELTLG